QQGRWFEASRILERIRPGFKAIPALSLQLDLQLAVCYERLDEPARQLAACQRVIAQDPSSIVGRQGMAAAQWALGRHDDAIAQSRETVKLNEALKAPTTGHAELARLLLLRTLQLEKRDWRPVAEELALAETEQPDSVDVVLLRAEMLNAQDRAKE